MNQQHIDQTGLTDLLARKIEECLRRFLADLPAGLHQAGALLPATGIVGIGNR